MLWQRSGWATIDERKSFYAGDSHFSLKLLPLTLTLPVHLLFHLPTTPSPLSPLSYPPLFLLPTQASLLCPKQPGARGPLPAILVLHRGARPWPEE